MWSRCYDKDHGLAMMHYVQNEVSRASHHGCEVDHSQLVTANYKCNTNHGQAVKTTIKNEENKDLWFASDHGHKDHHGPAVNASEDKDKYD